MDVASYVSRCMSFLHVFVCNLSPLSLWEAFNFFLYTKYRLSQQGANDII